MTDDLHSHDDLIRELEEKAITTSQGSFVKMEDARELIERRKKANAVEDAAAFKGKTVAEAREGAKAFLKTQGLGQKDVPEPGRSITAQPVSRP